MNKFSLTRTAVSYLLVFVFFAFNSVGFTLAQDADGDVALKLVPPVVVPPTETCPAPKITYNGPPPTEAETNTFRDFGNWDNDGPVDLHNQITIEGAIVSPGTTTNIVGFNSGAPIKTVYVYSATSAYKYDYTSRSPAWATNDRNLQAPGMAPIVKVTFCRAQGPTAADVTISGRVIDQNGRGISKAVVSMIPSSTGTARAALTNGFGYYFFDGVKNGDVVQLMVTSKRYDFTGPRTLGSSDTNDSVADVNFEAIPNN